MTIEEILKEAEKLQSEKKFEEIIELITDDILSDSKHPDLKVIKANAYNLLGDEFSDKEEYHEAIQNYKKAIEIDSKSSTFYNDLGNAFFRISNFSEAEKNYLKAIALEPDDHIVLNNLANTYQRLNNHKSAVEFANKALKGDAKNPNIYNILGNAYSNIKEFQKAIETFDAGIKIDKEYDSFYYNRALNYQKIGDYLKALEDFKKYILLTAKDPDYYTSIAKSRIIDLKKQIGNAEYKTISDLVSKIRDLLLFEGNCVTHYTSLSVSKILILDDTSKFRLSEGAYLNDTSEGRMLFNYLPSFHGATSKSNDTIAKPFAPKPFIGSFVAETKHDDLTLWRMYGKEEKDEAQGCAVTLERDEFLRSIEDSLIPINNVGTSGQNGEKFSFYRVAYKGQDSGSKFTIPGAEKAVVDKLNELMSDLYTRVKNYLPKRRKPVDRKNLIELLNEIAYLFKSAEYQYENELRLVVKGIGMEKNVESTPLRVYINLVNIVPLIKKITLGPKVQRAEEWASAFYYCLDKQDCYPEILISKLPFK